MLTWRAMGWRLSGRDFRTGLSWRRVSGLAVIGGAFLTLASCDSLPQAVSEVAKADQAEKAPPAPTYLPAPPEKQGLPLQPPEIVDAPPFVGEDGVDQFGYPLRRPDQVTLVGLLRLRRFDLLERYVTHYQDEFEKDYKKELWPRDAVVAFRTPEPEFEKLLDDWVKKSPESFVPWAVRGSYRNGLGWHFRGGGFAKETSAMQFATQQEYHAAAVADFEKAVELRPKFVAGYVQLVALSMSMSAGKKRQLDLMNAGVRQCPLCWFIRDTYMGGLLPRWGGSHEAMDAFAKSTSKLVAKNPKLALLRGARAADVCKTLGEKKEYAAAHQACDEALSHGDEADVLYTKVRIFQLEQRYTEMLPFIERGQRLSPHYAELRASGVDARMKAEDYFGAATDLMVFRHLEPTQKRFMDHTVWLARKLMGQGDELMAAGNDEKAAEYLELALKLVPNRQIADRLAKADSGRLPQLQAKAQADQRDFATRLRIDHVLASQQRWPEIVQMWDDYIANNPDDPRAYNERAGTYYFMGKRAEFEANTKKACELGMERACSARWPGG